MIIIDGTARIEVTSQSLTIAHSHFAALLQACQILNNAVPLVRIRLRPDPGMPVGDYEYLIQTVDGRTWRQTFQITSGNPARMKFNVNSWWTLSEFVPHRAIRDYLVEAVQQNGLTFFDYQW